MSSRIATQAGRILVLGATLGAFSPAVAAQTDAPPPSNPPQTQGQPAPAPPKKVWTDDNVSGLHATPGDTISQPGNPKASRAHAAGGTTGSAYPKNRNAKWYQDQITKLQAKIPPLDQQIAQLQSAIDGKPTGDAKASSRPRGVKADDWATQLAELQKQRQDILDKIAALQDQARHNGVPVNAVP